MHAPAELLRLQDQPRREGILHDGLRVPHGPVHLRRVQLAQDVEPGPVPAPVVGRARQIGVHGLVVPVQAGERALVLVLHAERVPDLVQGRRALPGRGQIPAEIHGALVQTGRQRVPAHRRPGAVTRLETDPQLRLRAVRDLREGHPDPQLPPLAEAVPHDRALFLAADPRNPTGPPGSRQGNDGPVARSVEEAVVQHGAVDPHPPPAHERAEPLDGQPRGERGGRLLGERAVTGGHGLQGAVRDAVGPESGATQVTLYQA